MFGIFGEIEFAVGDSYKHIPNAAIKGHNVTHLSKASVSQCKEACNKNSWCKSFDYYKGKKGCDLSDKSERDVALKKNYKNDPYDHYERSTNVMTSGGQIPDSEIKRLQALMAFKIPSDMQKKSPVIQWTMKAGSIGRPVLSGNHYQLVNMANYRGIKRQERTFAANLGFLEPSSEEFNMLIKRENGDGQVRYGDIIALNLKPYGWLKYKKQKYGINISDDNNTPHFIWQIRGGENGTKLISGMPFALYNLSPTIKSEMIFCERTHGIDLGWFPSSDCSTFMSRVSGKLFGPNGILSRDGYVGTVVDKMKDYICETAVAAASTYLVLQSGGTATATVAVATPLAIKECKKV